MSTTTTNAAEVERLQKDIDGLLSEHAKLNIILVSGRGTKAQHTHSERLGNRIATARKALRQLSSRK